MIITAQTAKHLYNTGYYKCDDQIFYSKIQACIYSSSVKKPITWIYNDVIFNNYNWTNTKHYMSPGLLKN